MPPMVRTVADAERLVIAEWHTWAKRRDSYTIIDMLLFYFGWLRKKKPELLAFPYQGQQWHVVRVWLQRDEGIHRNFRRSPR